jgi:hypothetical protein
MSFSIWACFRDPDERGLLAAQILGAVADAELTVSAHQPSGRHQRIVSAGEQGGCMNDHGYSAERAASIVRQAIGGDADAIAQVLADGDRINDVVVITMAALLERDPSRLARAEVLATSSRDRQVVAIAAAYLAGDRDRVDVMAREHLVDYPKSLIVAWIASGAVT